MTEHPLANYPRPPPRGEDLPYEDGEPMETARHRDQMYLLLYSLGENRDRTTLPPEARDFLAAAEASSLRDSGSAAAGA